MTNQMFHVKTDEWENLKQGFSNQPGLFVAEIDGEAVSTWADYAKEIQRVFCFPKDIIAMDAPIMNYYAYMDWIRDLSWLHADGYALIIRHPDALMKDSPRERQIVLETLEDTVLPWWESDVEKCVVEGKAKPFNVYLVE